MVPAQGQIEQARFNEFVLVAKGEALITPAGFKAMQGPLLALVRAEVAAAQQRRREWEVFHQTTPYKYNPNFNTADDWNRLIGLCMCLLMVTWQGNLRTGVQVGISPRSLCAGRVNSEDVWWLDVKRMATGLDNHVSKRWQQITTQQTLFRDKYGMDREVYVMLEAVAKLRNLSMDEDVTLLARGGHILRADTSYDHWGPAESKLGIEELLLLFCSYFFFLFLFLFFCFD